MAYQIKVNGVLIETDSRETFNEVLFHTLASGRQVVQKPAEKPQEMKQARVKKARYTYQPRTCINCKEQYTPENANGKFCQKEPCQKERKRGIEERQRLNSHRFYVNQVKKADEAQPISITL